ncbi:hypothetical protein [Hymenobacter negativus]|uniref:Lycopene cyclase domain-containing protein n=1 Tax=Hymenobacter negativus TaxID=2795026 RepID=A0ABS3Q8F7_9BACT|nr:hypothetical protein [Hymenobacter negativus]MBO2007530.1 hypothetical protein [Hymenobacter negativus]
MQNVSNYLSITFIIIALLAAGAFYRAANNSRLTLGILLLWLLVQALVARSGFYTITTGFPPRIGLLLGPPMLLIAGLFLSNSGRRYLDGLRLETLTLLHTVRIAVELILLGLFLHRAIPQLMTFEGRNYDILAGLTAPVVYYLVFRSKLLDAKGLLVWNFVCLGLLANIVVNAVLSAPSPFQRFAFEQPNVAILHFPFVWLPSCVVPLVLLAHLAAIRQLLKKQQNLTLGK